MQGYIRGSNNKITFSQMLTYLVIASIVLKSPPEVLCEKDLYLIGLLPFEGAWNGGEAVLAAIELALDQVNGRPDVLPGYRINFLWNNTKCDPGLGLNVMFHHLYTPPTKIMIIGGLCSIVTEVTAMVSYRWNVVQISPGSVSSALSDKMKYKKFLRTNSPDNDVNPARIHIFKEFGWSKIATIHQAYPIFSVSTDHLLGLMKQNGMTIITSELIGEDPAIQLQKLKDRGVRIIVGSFYDDMAVRIFCEAYKIGLYGPKIVWVIIGWYKDNWWKVRYPSVSCTEEEIVTAIDGYLAVDRIWVNPKPEMTVSGNTPQEIQEMYWNRTKYQPLPYLNIGLIGYDAVWTAALALNKTITDLEAKGLKKIEDFTYDDEEMSDILFANALSMDFYSARGRILFNANGDLSAVYRIDRFQNGKKQMVGLYYPTNEPGEEIEWLEDAPIVWKDGQIPRDSVIYIEITDILSFPLYLTMCCLAGLGSIMTCAFLLFNVVYRKTRIVKMSSPNLNNVTLAGCLLLYTTVFMESTAADTVVVVCQMKVLSLTIGFSMVFGALFSKTWRVYVIFTNGAKKRKIVKDTQLFIMVLILVIINVSILITWFMMDPLERTTAHLPTEVDPVADTELHRKVEHCESPRQIYFTASLFAVQGILLLFGVFLAFQTRQVKVQSLNDSKMIGICIYNVLVLTFLGVMVFFTLKSNMNLNYGITSFIIIMGTAVTQCLIFVPKMTKHWNKVGDEETTVFNTTNNAVVTVS